MQGMRFFSMAWLGLLPDAKTNQSDLQARKITILKQRYNFSASAKEMLVSMGGKKFTA